ncbi:uncharacterized protein LOC132734234 [Ruditapes philippinarum]|uniref:uncharacterized protein LOC132734234 n=1 Tax=Ruditapes philippinarum TaxID=129788 RepID=UPI00295BF2E8|nr:uncharacterized protein LOC132734234 [Ruditapes philippinarum]
MINYFTDKMEKCWLCPKEFNSRTDLYNHVISKEHRRQSVYCPWCPTEKTFTRVTDLNKHCNSRHFVEVNCLPKMFLSLNNCFYFAVYPQDYARLIKPQLFESSIAMDARRIMMQWVEKQHFNPALRDNIRKGWKAGLQSRINELENGKEEKENKKRKREAEEVKPSTEVKEIYSNTITNDTKRPKHAFQTK